MSDCTRRRWLVLAASVGPAWAAGPVLAAAPGYDSLAQAARTVEGLARGWRNDGPWTLAQVLEHAAQSIEYSLTGFPQPRSALFQATVGRAAFAVFSWRDRMSHALDEPIPGAPPLSPAAPIDGAVSRLLAAIQAFESHRGALAPHFAYGALDKSQYAQAHRLHLADHSQQFTRSTAQERA